MSARDEQRARTNIDYERLHVLVDKASPSPWTVKEDDDWGDVIVANECGHSMSWGDQVRFEMASGDKNTDPHLVALAPDMAHELLRLHRELTDLRELMSTHADYLRKDGHRIASNYAENHSRRLSRIMEGN